ncbi:TPA: hypothetical protein ACX6NV_000569 [Photobacterium damselae]
MNREKVYSFLTQTLGVKLYQDFVPETAELPAASYLRINDDKNNVLDGSVDLRREQYQVEIVHDVSRLECDKISNKVRKLDGHSEHSDFQLIDILNYKDVPLHDPDVEIFVNSMDIEFTFKTASLD